MVSSDRLKLIFQAIFHDRFGGAKAYIKVRANIKLTPASALKDMFKGGRLLADDYGGGADGALDVPLVDTTRRATLHSPTSLLHGGCVNTAAWNSSGTLLCTGSDDRRAKGWDARSDCAWAAWAIYLDGGSPPSGGTASTSMPMAPASSIALALSTIFSASSAVRPCSLNPP